MYCVGYGLSLLHVSSDQPTAYSAYCYPQMTEFDCPFVKSCLERVEIITRSTLLSKMMDEINWDKKITFDQYRMRRLSPVQIEILELSCSCRCPDWSRVLIMHEEDEFWDESTIGAALKGQVSHCRFQGLVIFGLTRNLNLILSSEDNRYKLLPPGLHYNTLIQNSIFEPGSRVYNNTTIESTHVACQGSIIHCGSLSRTRVTARSTESRAAESFVDFASSLQINVGPETGGLRVVSAFPEMTLRDAARDLQLSSHCPPRKCSSQQLPPPHTRAQMLATQCPLNIVSAYCTITNASSVKDVCLSPYSHIDGSSLVHNVTLLSHAKIEGGTVENSQLQWDAKATYAHVKNSLLMEHSYADKNSMVFSSVLGPDSHSSGGEVQYSILGPHVNSHHQSLIMATIWITGRGNVGYGCNLGSNHTGRLADQECWAGEGTFWGLSNVVKFPIDLTQSPYSIVAAGVQFMSQRVCLPFSLFTDHSLQKNNNLIHGNQCFPGWVLLHSPYTVARSEYKFSTRTKAKRHHHYTNWKISRPVIIDLCVKARRALQGVNCNGQQELYFSDRDIDGLGMCYMSESSRLDGIKVYSNFIQRYALHGLLDKIMESFKESSDFSLLESIDPKATSPSKIGDDSTQMLEAPVLPWDEPSYQNLDELWNHQVCILKSEFPDAFLNTASEVSSCASSAVVRSLLKHLSQLEEEFSKNVELSKKKDDARGVKIVPKYNIFHEKAEDDKTVILVRQETQRTVESIKVILQDKRHKLSHL